MSDIKEKVKKLDKAYYDFQVKINKLNKKQRDIFNLAVKNIEDNKINKIKEKLK